MRGLILAGGRGSRLHPLTVAVCKQLLAVYNKPMIYYPLSLLMTAGIREVLVITNPEDGPLFEKLLGDGTPWGMKISYAPQDQPRGLADAFRVGAAFVDGRPSCLILGDNLFHGGGITAAIARAGAAVGTGQAGATIFAYRVRDPHRYGVVEFTPDGRVVSVEEKPRHPKSDYAIPGLYFYDGRAAEFAAQLRPSPRGELEITDLHARYLQDGRLRVEALDRGTAWLDAGTHESLLQAANYVQAIEDRQGLMVGSPEEVAYRQGWIDATTLRRLAEGLGHSQYQQALLALAGEAPVAAPTSP